QSGASVTLQAQQGATTELVAYALSDGHELWRTNSPGAVTGMDEATIYTSTSPRAIPFTAPQPPEVTARDAATGRVLWQAQGDYADLYATTPAQPDGTTPYYIAKSLTGIVAFARATGAVAWQFNPVDDDPAAWLALFDGRHTLVYVARATLYAIDTLAGKILWQAALPSAELGPPTAQNPGVEVIYAANQQIYLQGGDGVTALDATSGHLRWHIDRPYQLLFP
nr:PQQ-binding-like beta-propeller repeat protein [Ktedonobacterales bacterium]